MYAFMPTPCKDYNRGGCVFWVCVSVWWRLSHMKCCLKKKKKCKKKKKKIKCLIRCFWLTWFCSLCVHQIEKELLKVLINSHVQSFPQSIFTEYKLKMQCKDDFFLWHSLLVPKSPGITGFKMLSQFYLFGKVHIPKVPGSQRALFSHTILCNH